MTVKLCFPFTLARPLYTDDNGADGDVDDRSSRSVDLRQGRASDLAQHTMIFMNHVEIEFVSSDLRMT